MNSIKRIESQLGQFSESIPFILVVQENDGDHLTIDNFSSNHNQIALIRVLKAIFKKNLPQQSVLITDVIKALKGMAGTEKFGQHSLPRWTETQLSFQHYDVLKQVRAVYQACIFDLENLDQIRSFLLCISPNDKNSLCRIESKERELSKKNDLMATMLLDYGRYYHFDPLSMLDNLRFTEQL